MPACSPAGDILPADASPEGAGRAYPKEGDIARQLILSVSLGLAGAVRMLMMAMGLGALAAAIASLAAGAGFQNESWAWLPAIGIKIALSLLGTVVVSWLLMPRTADLKRPVRREEESPSRLLAALLVVLAVAAILPWPGLVAWYAEDRALLRELIGKPDAFGFHLIPTAALYSMPTLAAAALVMFVVTSVVGVLAPAQHAAGVVMAGTALPAGLVAAGHLLRSEMRAVAERLFQAAPDPTASATAFEWLARHEAAGAPLTTRLVWILAGYVAAIAIIEFLPAARRSATKATPAAGERPAAADSPPVVTAPVPERSISSAAGAFDLSNYAVKPRRTWLESIFVQKYGTYDIVSIPPMARARFSFSWQTGIVRREPNGPDLLLVQQSERQSLFDARSYKVRNVATAASLGTLRPNGSEWEIVDPQGALVSHVVEVKEGPGFASYLAISGGLEVCRFTWGSTGLTVHSAELEVEFLRNADSSFDRAFAIVLAPILEQRARMASRPRS